MIHISCTKILGFRKFRGIRGGMAIDKIMGFTVKMYFIYLLLKILFVCLFVCPHHACAHRGAHKHTLGVPGAGVTGVFELPDACWGTN